MNKYTVNNGFGDIINTIGSKELNTPIALYNNASPYLITLNWVPLTNFFIHNGFMQSAVNSVVDDAFRNEGLIIDSKTLSTDELELLRKTMADNDDIEAIKNCIRWMQLYGGACLILNTEQDYKQKLNENSINGKKMRFLATDRWHCIPTGTTPFTSDSFLLVNSLENVEHNGEQIDKSRVYVFTNNSTPYFAKQLLGGWGLSIFESILPALNQYLEAMGVSLELISEAKIDIVKIFNLASTLLSPNGEKQIRKRLELVAQAKNSTSVIAMDSNDDYDQKQISFSSLPQMIEEIQLLVCAALKRPYSKIFGKGGNGLSEQTSDLENYNSIVDAEIRTPATKLIKWVIDLRCLQLFGRKLPDIVIDWKPLKIMTEKEEAEIKNKKLSDLLRLYDRGILSRKQVAQKLTEDNYVLFSEQEIKRLDDEVNTEDAENPEELMQDDRTKSGRS